MLSMTCYIDISISSFWGIFRWFSTFCWLTIVLKRCIKMFVHFVCAIICADDGANPWQFMHFEKSAHTHTQTHPNAGHHKTKLIAKIMDIEACYAFWDENTRTHSERERVIEWENSSIMKIEFSTVSTNSQRTDFIVHKCQTISTYEINTTATRCVLKIILCHFHVSSKPFVQNEYATAKLNSILLKSIHSTGTTKVHHSQCVPNM